MRIISLKEILIFWFLLFPAILMTYISYQISLDFLGHPFYRYMGALLCAFFVFNVCTLLTYRFLLRFFPFAAGEINPSSKDESRWMVYSLFWLFFFYPFTLPKWIPVPLTGLLYRSFGAKIGPMSYFSSVIYDPHLVQIGHHVLGGAQSLIIPHVTEGEKLAHYPIQIGNHVTIGAQAIILPGVTIEDHVIVGAGAVIKKGSHLKKGEVWVGNPAKLLKTQTISPIVLIDSNLTPS